MSGPSERMLELLSLLQDGRAWQGGELAARLGTSPRTLRRDIDRLRDLGYPVISARGPGGSYQLVAGRAMPPLLFTDDEAVAAVVGLRLVALAESSGGAGGAASAADETGAVGGASAAGGAAGGALRKLEQVLPSRLRYQLEAMSASTDAASRTMSSLDLPTLRLLGVAAFSHQDVRFGYTDRGGRRTGRRVEPYRQVLLGRHWYLLGWDLDRDDWRTFRLDRISDLAVPGSTFIPREPPPDASFVQNPLRSVRSRRQGVVVFSTSIEHVFDRLTTEAGSLEAIDADRCRYITAVDDWDWLAGRLAMVGVEYTVEGPPELVDATRNLAARIGRATKTRR
jgi:predicted DNA-binding transcriptional regulator YafY